MDLQVVQQEAHQPVGGRLQYFRCNWEQISRDPWILETISGCKLEFTDRPYQRKELAQIPLDKQKAETLDKELEKMVSKHAIELVKDTSDACFISPMFVVAKADGSWRPVINLKSLNRHIRTKHFKMESIRTAKGLLQEGDYMVKLDLKDAYLSVPLHPPHRKFVAFRWRGQLWRFKSLPFGLSSAPYIFTKLTKPVVAVLRRLGARVILYLDDMLIMARTEEGAKKHLATALELLIALGFVINMKKSTTHPAQSMEFLGFVLDSRKMSISLPNGKLKSIQKAASRLSHQRTGTVRQLAQLLGMMVAAHPAILPAPLNFRYLERMKTQALRKGLSYEAQLDVTHSMEADLSWWIEEAARHNGRPIQITHWDLTIETDASMMGWGAFCQGVRTGGSWTPLEKQRHINYLELLAVFLALKSFLSNKRKLSVLLRVDNVTAIAFLNRMGGTHSQELSDLAVEVWKWCLESRIIIHAEHLPGRENTRADWESRHVKDTSDWSLRRDIFLQLETRLGPFSIDLFASRTNTQLPIYCSWRPDPGALTVDALSLPWGNHHAYMFPPFALITRCLEKLQSEQASAVLVAPVWPNQLWYPLLLKSLMDFPVLLMPVQNLLIGSEGQSHPLVLQGHLPLAAWPISGDPFIQKDFQRELSSLSGNHGATQQSQHTLQHGANGIAGAFRRGIDPLSAPLKDILEFLMVQFQTGKQYRTINTLRSAISMTHTEVDGVRVGQHPLVSRLLKGVFNSRPPAPRYSRTWDVSGVLTYLENSPENKDLTLQALAHKVAMLMALSNANRCSDLAALDLNHRTYQTNGVKFIIPGLTKSRRNGPPIEAFYPSFQGSPKLCPVRALREYEERSQELRKGGDTNPLFVSVRRPYAPVKPCTIGKWLKKVMADSGIDTSVFSAHSTRGAATSKAKVAGVSTADILRAANWSSESTFCRFYHRPIHSPEFGLGVLRK